MKLIALRVRNILNAQQPREQAGFRKSFSTMDHLHTINQIIEKAREYQLKIHFAFIDYTKAFDSLSHQYLLKTLNNQGIPSSIIKIIERVYSNLRARIVTDQRGRNFNVEKGIKQGDPLSSLIFISALEGVFRELEWKNKGLIINGEKISNLRFADDVVLISTDVEELNTMVSELNEKGKEAELEMNVKKCKIMSPEKHIDIEIDGQKIEVSEVEYLGQLLDFENATTKEVNKRITLAWKKFWSLKIILKGPFSNYHKSQIFNSCIIPTLSYGAQTWALTKKKRKQTESNTKLNGAGYAGYKS